MACVRRPPLKFETSCPTVSRLPAALFTALVLGLAWAVRGRFGHEWGAAWAGATGGLAVLAAAGRVDWLRRLPTLTAAAAIGWGIGGAMSYGIVIGYCRADTWHNSLYGYAMLAVIGGLYGFTGGGLFGAALESTERRQPNWFILISGMVAGACLLWGLVIYQLEWFMTPPRSEAWALCAGAALALAWYLYDEGFHRALRVASWAGLGGAFGFAVGNFIQTLGSLSGVAYNWWNVMEFTLGFFGGLGMGYAVFSQRWPDSAPPAKGANWLAVVFLAALLPWANYVNGFDNDKLQQLAAGLAIEDPSRFAVAQQTRGLALWAIVAVSFCLIWKLRGNGADASLRAVGSFFLFAYTAYYVVFGLLVNGFFHRNVSLANSGTLYLPLLGVAAGVWLAMGRGKAEFKASNDQEELDRRLALCSVALVATVIVIAAATVHWHDQKMRFKERFPTKIDHASPA